LPFSPLADEGPDDSADVCWLPGGYPELHAGPIAANQRFRKKGLKRMFLHASHMSFELDGRAYGFSAPLPDELKDFLDKLRPRGKTSR